MTKSAKQILIEARELITPEERWTQNWFARDDQGNKLFFPYENAKCFCAVGAIKFIDYGPAGKQAIETIGKIVQGGIMVFNDENTHAEVLAAFDRAIAIA